MQFRIRYTMYRIEAENSSKAKEKLMRMTGISEDFFSLEDASIYDVRRPLWRRLISG